LLIDESDDGDWSIADKSGEMGNVVERLLAGCSQNAKATETFETGIFILWERELHERLTTTTEAVPSARLTPNR
jgi:hypothetical protein